MEKEKKSRIVFYNGEILTMEKRSAGTAVLVEDGKIRALGDAGELLEAAGDAARVDLEGNTLMPAFVDAHSHFTQVAFSTLQASLEGAGSREEAVGKLQAFLRTARHPKGAWVLARDYDNTAFPDGRHLTLAELDGAAPENPLFVQHKSGHIGLFNSLALKLLGVRPDTPSPEGGRIGKEDGRLTGYMEENALFAFQKRVPMPGPEELEGAFEKAQKLYASFGITTVQDGMAVKEMLPLYDMLLGKDLLWLDLAAYPDPETYALAKRAYPGCMETYWKGLRFGGMKIFLDGSPQGRTAWMRTPYLGGTEDRGAKEARSENAKEYCGYGTMTDENVLEAMGEAAREETQLLAHCNGDAAAEQYLRCLERAEEDWPGLGGLRPVLIHGQLIGRDQLPRAARLGVILSLFVAHVYHWGDVHIRNFGLERACKISPAASALRCGIPVTFHQDAPVILPDMFETIWCAVRRLTKQGVLLGGEERISPAQALRAVTINAAYQYGEEKRKGSIVPGKQADLIVTDKNPLKAPAKELRNIQVLRTYKEGVCVYSR